MNFAVNLILIILITLVVETIMYVGIGELFNKIYKKSKVMQPNNLGKNLFEFYGESVKLAKKIKDSSETLEPRYAALMQRTPVSVPVALVLMILWCITGIAAYIVKINIIIAVLIMAVELVPAVIVGKKLSEKMKNDGGAERKCMKCKLAKLSTFHTIRLNTATFASVRMPNGSRYKMIHVVNYTMRDESERNIDVDIPCIVYYDFLPFAKCVIDPKDLPRF